MPTAAEYKRNARMFVILGLVGLALGAFLYTQGTTLAPVVILVSVVDLLVAGWMMTKAKRA
jgi:uncharacterized membrane protein HdeD (DUF308 family)